VTETAWPERIDPLDTAPGVVAHHLKKYEFARGRIHGTVVDVACGVGYGTHHLAPQATSAIGVELAGEAIDVARTRYRRDNVWFIQANAEALPFENASIDVVTCFEGIEHFDDPDHHLDEVVRILKPGGRYLVSTPNPETNPHDHENPFHLHQFEVSRMEAMLAAKFGRVEMLGQFRRQTEPHRRAQQLDVLGIRRWRVIRPLTRLLSRRVLGTTPTEEATLDDFSIEPFTLQALEYVAVCEKAGDPI
jgi:2-polyprenyl-3-methyl-5-hydroxy-6-metoxy-1,4-benzoquinol methylase